MLQLAVPSFCPQIPFTERRSISWAWIWAWRRCQSDPGTAADTMGWHQLSCLQAPELVFRWGWLGACVWMGCPYGVPPQWFVGAQWVNHWVNFDSVCILASAHVGFHQFGVVCLLSFPLNLLTLRKKKKKLKYEHLGRGFKWRGN